MKGVLGLCRIRQSCQTLPPQKGVFFFQTKVYKEIPKKNLKIKYY